MVPQEKSNTHVILSQHPPKDESTILWGPRVQERTKGGETGREKSGGPRWVWEAGLTHELVMEMADPTRAALPVRWSSIWAPVSGLITVGQYCYSPLLTSEGHCGLDGTGHLAKVTKLVAEVGFRLSLPILRVHTASPMGLCPQAQGQEISSLLTSPIRTALSPSSSRSGN